MNIILVILLVLLTCYIAIKLYQYFLREKYMTPEEQSWVGRERGILHGSGEIGGVVWTNGNYYIAKEAPGLSWIL
jgi:hypothetical protein